MCASCFAQVIIYSGDGLTAQQLLKSAASNFNITVTDKFKVQSQNSSLTRLSSIVHIVADGGYRLGHRCLASRKAPIKHSPSHSAIKKDFDD